MRPQIDSRRTGRRAAAGFSLIEVSVGMVVVGIVCVALYSGLTSGMATVRRSRENERATQILMEKLDTIRLYSWDKIITPDFIPTTFTKPFGPTNTSGSLNSAGVIYSGQVTIASAPVSAGYATNMRQVTVRVDWVSGSVQRSSSMTTMVAKDGMQNYVY